MQNSPAEDAHLAESGLFGPGAPLSTEAVAALRAHPRFAEAARQVSQCLTSLYQGNRILNQLVNDRGRVLLGFLLLQLHYAKREDDPQSGLTAGRVVDLCVEHGICSRGRAKALLMLMRVGGYLAPAPGGPDKRIRLLVPTERLTALHYDRWRCQFRAIALILPEGERALQALDDPRFVPVFLDRLSGYFFSGHRVLGVSPELGAYIDRNAGLLILLSLLLASDAENPERPVPISISGLANRYSVSRAHVLKFLRDAAGDGLIARPGPGDQIALTPRFIEALEKFLANMFLFNVHAAREALAAMQKTVAA